MGELISFPDEISWQNSFLYLCINFLKYGKIQTNITKA